ncbi:MAG: lipoprotein-releasing ABC transporter permease subunit [Sulfitobacter sp.]
MANTTAPFAPFEWMIAWRYLRARRAEGGVSTMTWISLAGITLAVFALIATLAVRAGFRAEFVDTIVGANAHVTVYEMGAVQQNGLVDRKIYDYEARAAAIEAAPGVTRVAPLVRGQVMASHLGSDAGMEIYGIAPEDLATIPRIADPETAIGDIERFGDGIAIGSGIARALGVGIGDRIRVLSANGVRTPMGTSPRVNAYEVTYIFTAGRYDIDRTRAYLPLGEAQTYFNSEGAVHELEVMVTNADDVEQYAAGILGAAGDTSVIWTWRQQFAGFLDTLDIEDNVMSVIMSILVLVATMNIISGLIMLVKNKGRDIGILRTMGLSEGSVLRVFFICGAFTGIIGTVLGVILGCLFVLNVNHIFGLVNWLAGGNAWDASIRGIYFLPAKLELGDVIFAISLSLGLSFIVTIFPARRAARMNPVEALRYE